MAYETFSRVVLNYSDTYNPAVWKLRFLLGTMRCWDKQRQAREDFAAWVTERLSVCRVGMG
jgi:hypothetical protein